MEKSALSGSVFGEILQDALLEIHVYCGFEGFDSINLWWLWLIEELDWVVVADQRWLLIGWQCLGESGGS